MIFVAFTKAMYVFQSNLSKKLIIELDLNKSITTSLISNVCKLEMRGNGVHQFSCL
ncbi:hypothetical protein [Streptococcus cristatus]|uniref:hypothetical protein n=1 Tax=Streptococcus cristatus TaxID=45634 RepID=UPI0038B3EBA0